MSIPLLDNLNSQIIPYAHCAWCNSEFRVLKQLEDHYLSTHNVVIQVSCCSLPSIFQTVMGMELQLRQSNSGPYSTQYAELKHDTTFEKACQNFKATEGSSSIHCPSLSCVDTGLQEPQDEMLDPTNPALSLSDVKDGHVWWHYQTSVCLILFWRMPLNKGDRPGQRILPSLHHATCTHIAGACVSGNHETKKVCAGRHQSRSASQGFVRLPSSSHKRAELVLV